MNEKFNKKAKVEQLNKMFLSREEEKGLIVKGPWSGVERIRLLVAGKGSFYKRNMTVFAYRKMN